ncbi:MAG: hypothetical protein QF682_11945 [Candidatus Thermoplasmatota archaeon]|nr:hypothetical protein [Candidatus Thermoplasmatota archaeon]
MPSSISTFIRQVIKPDPHCKLNRQRAILFLFIVFIVVTIYIRGFEHGVEGEKPHLKDEEGFYGWAELYTEGYYSIPLQEARGTYYYDTVFTTKSDNSAADITTIIGSFDESGKNNDLKIEIAYVNGTPVFNANVSIKLKGGLQGGVASNITDENGTCILYDIPMGIVPLEIIIPRENDVPAVMQVMIDSKSKGGRYNIYATVEVEKLTYDYLGTALKVERIVNGTSEAIFQAKINVNGQFIGETDLAGVISLSSEDREHAFVRIRPPSGSLMGLRVSLGALEGITDEKGAVFFAVENDYELSISVEDIFGIPVEDVNISVDPEPPTIKVIDTTGNDGKLKLIMKLKVGEHRLVAHKNVDGYIPPLASGVAVVDGEYHYVNHWPPGPSVVISWLIYIGAEDIFGVLVVILLSFSTWGVARRIFGWKVAATATFLAMTCGITLQLYFGHWMGDLSSTAFAMGGLWLFLISVDMWKKSRNPDEVEGKGERDSQNNKIDWDNEPPEMDSSGMEINGHPFIRRWVLPTSIAILSGLLFGCGVTMRYSTLVACSMPYIYFLGLSIKEASVKKRAKKNDAKRISGFIKNFFSKRSLGRWIGIIIPLTVGMIIIGSILMCYNAKYFGGPMNSGYQSQNILAVINADTSGNQSLESYEPPNSFFESYFIWGDDDKENAPYIFQYMLIFVPILFLSLPALWFLRKEPLMFALFAWILLTFVIYLSQGWVLKRTIEDIRYYSPLIPPCAILGGSILVRLGQGGFWRNPGRAKKGISIGIPLIIISLLLVATVTAGNFAIEERTEKSKMGPQQGGMNELILAKEVSIPQLLENPLEYKGKPITVTHGIVDKIMDPAKGLALIRDERTPDKKIVLNPIEAIQGLELEMKIEATGTFKPPPNSSGYWQLIVERTEDVEKGKVIIINITINSLLDQPDDFDGKRLNVIHAIVERIINAEKGIVLIRDDRFPDKKIVLNPTEPLQGIDIGARLEAFGTFVPDNKKPGNWMLRVDDENDVKILSRGGAEADLDGNATTGLEDYGTRNEDTIENMGILQASPPGGQGTDNKPGIPSKSRRGLEHQPLDPALKTAQLFSIAGLTLFYLFGLISVIGGRVNRKHSIKMIPES